MRRRRSRLPIVLLGGLALVLGAVLAVAASSRPAPDFLAWLNGGAASASAGAAAGGTAPGASGAPSADAGSSAAASSAVSSAGAPGPSGSDAGATIGPTTGSPAPTPALVVARPTPSPSTGTATPSPQTATGGAAKAVYNGSRAKKVVALTFDDGYNPVALRQILAILKREKVVATFFPYGWAVHQDVEGWHMVVAAGYPIGNHTLSHANLASLTPDQVTDQLVRGRRTIDLYSGGTSVPLMRPPGGAFNAVTARAIAKAGYRTIVMWDVDTFDWKGPSAATILARATKGTNGSIVLMHSGPLNTPKALAAIIANYRARGFTFVTVPQLLAGR